MRCPDCGAQLASERALAGLCPQCLFSLALVESGVEEEESATIVRGKAPAAGEILGERYQIRSVLGRGGQGEVFRAFDLKLRVDVALKALRPELVQSEEARERLRSEVRSAREVVSPHVCRVFDLVVEDGRELVSMEYIDGTTLSEILKSRGPLELTEAGEIASQFLSGLEAIHDASLVHRDLKPENVMVTRAGRVVVMDFGIAKELAPEEETGTIAGTLGYMAPEQARGASVDARADVFSAGVVLTEMTSGAKTRNEREELWRALRESPPKVPETPWAPVLQRALSWDAKARYRSARDLARALEEVTLRLPGYEERSPYPGLRSFTEEDRQVFFGRELDVEALWKKLKRPRLLALIGPSGAGKSSFLKAGLLVALPEGYSHVWLKPGSRPFQSLARALVPQFSGEDDAMELLLRFEDQDIAVPLVKRWRSGHQQAIVVIDQFEELFTLNPTEVQQGFADLLGRLALEADVHVLLSMRDDFLFHCQSYEALAPIFSELTPLGTLSESAMRRALIQPALACGYRFEDERLVDEMVSEVKRERGALPLLAFAASKLWERRDRQQGLLTREAYEHIGGVGGSLAQHAEATLEKIGRERIPVVRELFRNLVTSQSTRAAREREELLALFEGEEREVASEVLDSLIDARLLTSYEVPGRETETHRIEIIHESLLSAWPRLVHWQSQDAEGAQLRDELRQAAQRWEGRNRSDEVLWTGSAFQEFQLWRQRYPGSLTPLEDAFGQAMAARAVRRKRNRTIAVAAAFAVLVGVVAIVGTLWRQAVSEALRAEASKLLALGQLELEIDPTSSVAYALKSLELADTDEARLFALRSLQEAPPAIVLPTPIDDGRISVNLDFSPDGEWLAWGGVEKVLLQSRNGGAPVVLGELQAGNWIQVAFGPKGDRLLTVQVGEIRFWDTARREELRRETLEGITSIWGSRLGWFTSTRVEDRRVVRLWPFEGGDARFMGSFEPSGDLDATSEQWVRRSGPRIYVQPLRSSSVPPRLVAEHSQDFRWLQFRPGGEQVASIDQSDAIHLWSMDPEARNPLRRLGGRGLSDVLFDPRGTMLASIGLTEGHAIHYVWDLAGPPDAEPMILTRNVQVVQGYRFDPNGEWLATAHERDIAFWPIANDYPRILVRRERFRGVVFTPDREWIVSTSSEGVEALPLSGVGDQRRQILWEQGSSIEIDSTGDNVLVADGRTVVLVPLHGGPTRTLGELPGNVRDVAFSPSGRLAAAAQKFGAAEDKVIHVWNLETGETEVLGPLEGAGSGQLAGVETLQFLGENRILAGAWGGLHLANLEDGTVQVLDRDEHAFFPSIAASDDGSFILFSRVAETFPDGELVRLDLDRGTQRTLTSHGTRVIGVALDPTGSLIATGSTDGVIRVGPIDESEEPHLLLGHTGIVQEVAFSPDGRFLASSSTDETGRLWPVPRGRPFHRLPYKELVRRLRSVTNVRVVEDDASSTGYSLGLDPFPGWEKIPRWSDAVDGSR